MSSNTLSRLATVFREVFEEDELVITRATTARDVPGWDSVMHVNLMIATERAFKLRFRSGDIAGLKDVGQLVDLIDSRLGA